MRRRRGGTITAICTHSSGCRETGIYEYDNLRDAARIQRDYVDKWKCLRHSRGGWLTPDNLSTSTKLTVVDHGSFRSFGEIRNGYAHGPGFNAYASELPIGTVIEVVTRVILPEDRSAKAKP